MAEQPSSARAMLPAFFSAEHLEASARRTGLVTRASTMTGKLFLALVTFGVWSDAHTTLAPWAATVTPWDERLEIAPEALSQRMNKSALACLQDRIRHALAHIHSLENVCDEGLFPGFPTVYLAERTGCGLPDSLHHLLPGSGGSAANAGATIHAVWDDKRSVLDHVALTPWNVPDQQSVDNGVA